jgi:hypothetical protein
MYPEWSMKVLAVLKKAYRADALTTVVGPLTGGVGCWALIDGEWSTAAIFLSLSAVQLVSLRQELGPKTERLAKWSIRVSLAAAIAFLGVGCAAAVKGDILLAVISVLAAVAGLYSARMERRRLTAGRPKISI